MPEIESKSTKEEKRTPRWQFRKAKKLERRRKQRQKIAIDRLSKRNDMESDPLKSLAERQKYEQAKKQWEEREEKYKLTEMAKAEAKAKEEKAKAIAKKKWQEMLLSLPIITAPTFSATTTTAITDTTDGSQSSTSSKKKPVFKKFVDSSDSQHVEVSSKARRCTYRDRFQKQKIAAKKKEEMSFYPFSNY
ncbi:hypothetical protein BDF20DRAFT_431371 [Mycotypha africana]|uniref:uncharacterized protein n=1 Tax=Mycotypha africana TaxID=64632 RepID=UPI002301B46D|nr:uncharacterized protein BDF20DRAFT_431371 [Mycotypha africana]KAI8981830.1 hypothetical protein BDF20DRAFT_431371 [Mycotypha africana]